MRGIKIVIVLGLLGLGVACSTMRWNECRRVHPAWYCLAQR